jgi:Xaa-Pro aminopeptidase
MKSLFEAHRSALESFLEVGDMAILFSGKAPKSTADAHYSFLPNKNFYYFTGCTEEHFILVMLKTDKGLESTLFIEKPDYDVEKWVGRKLTREAATEVSGILDVQYIESAISHVGKAVYNGKVERLFLDLEKLNWDENDSPAASFAGEFSKRYPFVAIKSLHFILSELRVVKSEEEIAFVQKAIDLTHKGLDGILEMLKPGVFEYQIEATFAYKTRMNGAERCSFETIAASGGDAVILHYVENSKKVSDGELVLLDLGAQFKQYAADISRTYPVNGKFTERQKEIYNIVLKAQETVISAMKPGVPYEALNKICQETLTSELLQIGLIKEASELSKYYYHGVGHYLGLDVHDIGSRNGLLKPGMILTVEPGLYIAEEGIGIRIEDDVLITEAGNEVLSKNIPKTVEAIEAIMANR